LDLTADATGARSPRLRPGCLWISSPLCRRCVDGDTWARLLRRTSAAAAAERGALAAGGHAVAAEHGAPGQAAGEGVVGADHVVAGGAALLVLQDDGAAGAGRGAEAELEPLVGAERLHARGPHADHGVGAGDGDGEGGRGR